MALIGALGHLSIVLALTLLAIAFGARWLQRLELMPTGGLEASLYAAGISFVFMEVAVFALGMLGWLHKGTVLALLAGMALLAGRGWLWLVELTSKCRNFFRELKKSPQRIIPGFIILGFLLFYAFMAMAPLTGSDAMHYHFTAPMLQLEEGFKSSLWLSNIFLTGQSHQLILLGLAMGSDRISLGLIYLGGVLTAGALFVLARELMTLEWAIAVVLSFILTPMVYWQMTTSGSPDIWMAFYTTLAVLTAARGVQKGEHRWLALAGLFAGAAAGAKYTGWVIPGLLAAVVCVETRSLRWGSRLIAWSLIAGIYPLLRNLFWTGDPFFPFLTQWLAPENFNAYAFATYLRETRGADFQITPSRLLAFPFLVVLKGDDYGVGHYFGPLVLGFAPLLLFAPRKIPVIRIVGLLWAGVFLFNAFTSQMGRFLLPVLPIALAFVFLGVAIATKKWGRLVRGVCWSTLLVFFLFAIGVNTLYAKNFLPVVFGLETQDAFLERMAPDYQIAAFVNQTLRHESARVLVFFRHLYYLRLPFIYGQPADSWPMNPNLYQQPDQLLRLFKQLGVRWVVKAPHYPDPLNGPLERLEAEGWLQPIAATEVETFAGHSRIVGAKTKIHVVILKVADHTH